MRTLVDHLEFFLLAVCATTTLVAADKSDKTTQPPMELQSSKVAATASANTPALHYQLPRNYFRFQFKVKTSTSHQGRYCDVITYFFDVEKPDSKDCKSSDPGPTYSAEVGPEISVTELAEPDPSQHFDLQIGRGFFNETNLTLSFTEGNVLTGLQSTVADHKVDFFISILKTAAGIASHLINPLAPAAVPPASTASTATKKFIPGKSADCSADLDESERTLLNRLGTSHRDYACSLSAPELRSAYLNVPDRYRTFIDAYLADGNTLTSHFLNALALFIEYSDILRDERQFFRPERLPAGADGFVGIRSARDNKLKQIRQQFLGSSEDRTDDGPDVVWHFGGGAETELFSFDSATNGGFCFNTADANRWFARAVDVGKCDSSSNTLVTVFGILYPEWEPKTEAASGTAAKAAAPDGNASGLAYRIPGRASLRVFARLNDKGKSEFDYFRQSFDIAQFGSVKYLPSRIGSSTTYNVSLDPLTGALKNIVVGVKPVLSGDTAQPLGDLSTSLLGVVDAVKAARKKPSELDNLQDQEKLKLEQFKIQLIDACKSDPTQSFCAGLFK